MHARDSKPACSVALFLAALVACGAETPDAVPVLGPTEVGPGTTIEGRDEDGTVVYLRIDAVEPDPRDPSGELHLYTMSAQHDGQWQPYCLPDAEGATQAVVVPGSWDDRGAYHDDPGLTTFACTKSAIAKCVRFGYAPWKVVDGVSLRDHHLACIRMVRADYCGDGVSHTREGTPIDIWDALGVVARAEAVPEHEVFEAAWSPEGAVYVNTPRWSDDVREVSRDCPQKLAGRTSRDVVLDPLEVAARHPEALLFNARFVAPGR
jgi:hypothetical protein